MSAVARVLHEVRRRAHDLVARLDHRAEERDERPRRADRHDHLVGRALHGGVGKALLPVDVVRHRRAHRRDAGVRAVAEAERLDRLGGDFLQRLLRRRGRRHVRIAEREVADGLRAVLRLELKPLLEHLADPGRSRHGFLYLIGYQLHFGTTFPSIDSVYCITSV